MQPGFRADPPLHDLDVLNAVGALACPVPRRRTAAPAARRRPGRPHPAGRHRRGSHCSDDAADGGRRRTAPGRRTVNCKDTAGTPRLRPMDSGTTLPHSRLSGGITTCAGPRQPQCRDVHRLHRQPQRPTGQVKRPVCRRQETGAVHRRDGCGGRRAVASGRHGRRGGSQHQLPAGTGHDRRGPCRGRRGDRREAAGSLVPGGHRGRLDGPRLDRSRYVVLNTVFVIKRQEERPSPCPTFREHLQAASRRVAESRVRSPTVSAAPRASTTRTVMQERTGAGRADRDGYSRPRAIPR